MFPKLSYIAVDMGHWNHRKSLQLPIVPIYAGIWNKRSDLAGKKIFKFSYATLIGLCYEREYKIQMNLQEILNMQRLTVDLTPTSNPYPRYMN